VQGRLSRVLAGDGGTLLGVEGGVQGATRNAKVRSPDFEPLRIASAKFALALPGQTLTLPCSHSPLLSLLLTLTLPYSHSPSYVFQALAAAEERLLVHLEARGRPDPAPPLSKSSSKPKPKEAPKEENPRAPPSPVVPVVYRGPLVGALVGAVVPLCKGAVRQRPALGGPRSVVGGWRGKGWGVCPRQEGMSWVRRRGRVLLLPPLAAQDGALGRQAPPLLLLLHLLLQ